MSGTQFPPGVTCCPKLRTRSTWREFQFAFHQVLAAITPTLPLYAVLIQWNQVQLLLANQVANGDRSSNPYLSAYGYPLARIRKQPGWRLPKGAQTHGWHQTRISGWWARRDSRSEEHTS